MADPDPHDDTSADYEQFEQGLLVQDRDVAGVDTADVDDATALSGRPRPSVSDYLADSRRTTMTTRACHTMVLNRNHSRSQSRLNPMTDEIHRVTLELGVV